MATFEGRGGYVYEELSDGSFKIVKSPKSKGGQIISKDDPIWMYVNKEKQEVGGGEMSRKEAKDESAGYTVAEQQGKLGRPSSVDAPQSEQGFRSAFGDARMAAARAAASKDTSPMAMAVERAKTSPGGTTPGMNRRPAMDMSEQTQASEPSTNPTPVSPAKPASSSSSSSSVNKVLSDLGIPPERQEEALTYLKSAYSK